MAQVTLKAISFLLLVIYDCTKNLINKLSLKTHIGYNSFGRLLNGKVWKTARSSFLNDMPATAGGFYRNFVPSHNVYIKAYSDKESFRIFLKDAIPPSPFVMQLYYPSTGKVIHITN
jgi:hypothetical protein